MNWISVKDKPLCIYEGEYDLEILVKGFVFAEIETKTGLEYFVINEFDGGWPWEEVTRYVLLDDLVAELDAKLPHN